MGRNICLTQSPSRDDCKGIISAFMFIITNIRKQCNAFRSLYLTIIQSHFPKKRSENKLFSDPTADSGIRTRDLLITNQLLYQLSHISITEIIIIHPFLKCKNLYRKCLRQIPLFPDLQDSSKGFIMIHEMIFLKERN